MARYPVIMCGGSGSRLWPASTPSRPKQFIPLIGDRSPFQETALRVAPLAGADGAMIVVAGQAHLSAVRRQLSEIDLEAIVLIEPEARDSGPAMAAAAVWLSQRDPDAVAAFVASDHHVPDVEAFRRALEAASELAEAGRLVTLGVKPTEPASGYGYIRPAGPGPAPVAAFVEKPDADTARRWMAEGYLWNSGNFIVRADILSEEVGAHAPELGAAAVAAVEQSRRHPVFGDSVVILGDAFRSAPRLSIDYAVMEKTRRAWVVPVSFDWSDLGAWDAVARADTRPSPGARISEATDGCYVRAGAGVTVATVGVSNLAVIVEPNSVLVCDLGHAQAVKGVAARAGAERAPDEGLVTLAQNFSAWLRTSALPLWSTLGVEADGGFADAMEPSGRLPSRPRRARVQARQVYVFAAAGARGWRGPWRQVAERGLARFIETSARPDGRFATLSSPDGRVIDPTATVYDQAFVLFAYAALASAGVAGEQQAERASRLATALEPSRHVAGGWREAGDHPFQANAHMHLLEACLAWESLAPTGPWTKLSDEIAELALSRFVDSSGTFLREFFDHDWRTAPGADGRLVEPGHQFEWSWLLARWSQRRQRPEALLIAQALFRAGSRGVDHTRGVAVDAMDEALRVTSAQARLWPQTERLKAALLLAERAPEHRAAYLKEAQAALRGLRPYLSAGGTWRDKLKPDGTFVDEPSPASSLYHIFSAYEQLAVSADALPELGEADLSLA